MQYTYPIGYGVTELEDLIHRWRLGIESSTAQYLCFPAHRDIAAPVPFFGNIGGRKVCLFTVGTNPDVREFLDEDGNPYETPRFFNPKRFIGSWSVNSLFKACSEYFVTNPNTAFFGGMGSGEALEGVVNLLDASYYDTRDYGRQAVHLNIMPYPTIEPYDEFRKEHPDEAEKYITKDGVPLVISLASQYSPALVLCFGKEACERLLGEPAGDVTVDGKPYQYYKGRIAKSRAFGISAAPGELSVSDWKSGILPLMNI